MFAVATKMSIYIIVVAINEKIMHVREEVKV